MTSFTTRVELHGGTAEDYTKLHKAMAAQGFRQTITGGDGKVYHLPTAEYDISGSYTGEQVRTKAATAATTTGRSHAVLVSEAPNRWWVGLAQAKVAA